MKKDDARDVALSVLGNESHKDSILRRAAAGTLPPAVEAALWSLACGGSARPDRVTRMAAPLSLVNKDSKP